MTIYLEVAPDEQEHEEEAEEILTRAETAECTCPEFCERDHGNE
jgi:hypothetical protein